ncbi:ATP-binding protein [Tahibacter amnicola]|uniref:ATP-binding protein n=1 Tax=Tahibacter amnicola TaxID=2976241 RepID=A0ABY6BP88_9GAMM|nr:ATP-binding protein [Tahibacter amnicola]UXI70376.1 ATP-binding protein [Tahibacter amnicola]
MRIPDGILRKVIIVLVTVVIGSILIIPSCSERLHEWNNADHIQKAYLSKGWSGLQYWKMVTVTEYADSGKWPRDLAALGDDGADPVFAFAAPDELVLEARVKPGVDKLESLAGKALVFRYEPRAQQWKCELGTPPLPVHVLPSNCENVVKALAESGAEAPLAETSAAMLRLIAMCCIVLVGLGVIVLLRHPVVGPVQRNPGRLVRTPVTLLPRIDSGLRMLRRRDDVLAAARVTMTDWEEAVRYSAAAAVDRAQTLALRVGARCTSSNGWTLPGEVFEWQFSAELPVTLERAQVWLPRRGVAGENLVRYLRQVQTGLDVLLVLSPELESEAALRAYCQDRANLCVLIDLETQTGLLLRTDPLRALIQSMAQQLRATRISPYQTRGGVSRPSSFFGREALLSRIIHREPGNYLVVGGRQLGKTSLMKAIERRLRDHPKLACLYISLRDHRLAPRLATQCGLPVDTSLDAVVAHLLRQHPGRRLLVMIDEADPFFRHDACHHYAELSALRAISEEGHCHFLLAGFWDLYAAAALDYQSPLRNFGEVITVGGLEPEACQELATVPLHLLNLHFADSGLIGRIIRASGYRANLVAILCQECLEGLQQGERVILEGHVDRAMRSQATLDALAGWGRLTHEDAASRLDRIIVYYVALNGSATLSQIVLLTGTQGADIDVDTLRRAFARLQLAFVLARQDDTYRFAVPLFQTQFEPAELPVYLAQELKGL